MKISNTDFKDLFVVTLNSFEDVRGSFKEVYSSKTINEYLGYKLNFVQDNSVFSKRMSLRGLHFQKNDYAQFKYIYVTQGEILDVVVDIREDSKMYGKYFSIFLSSKKNNALLIPKGFAHGYLTLSKTAIVNYKVDKYYNINSEDGIAFDDETLNINWGFSPSEFIISKKDSNFKKFPWKKHLIS